MGHDARHRLRRATSGACQRDRARRRRHHEPAEVDWITRGIGAFFPAAWARFQAGAPEAVRAGSMAGSYHRLLMHPDPSVHEKAARDWCDWEIAIVALHAEDEPNARYEDPAFRLAFARLVTHYWRHHAWLEDGALLRSAHRLADIPGVLVHGRLDLCAPLATAWHLARQWPGSELIVVDRAGHDAGHPGIADHIVAATDRFADRRDLRRPRSHHTRTSR